MSYIPLVEIKVGQELDQIFFVSDVLARKTKARKPFTILTVKDLSGVSEIKVWGFDAEHNPDLAPGSWVKIRCAAKDYQGRVDLTTEDPPMVVPQPEDISAYVNQKRLTDGEIEEHWGYLVKTMQTVKNPYLKEYLRLAFKTHKDGFCNGAASASNRGAFKGGLVEHVSKVMTNALHCLEVQLGSKYRPKDIDRDLIIAGVMMHDIGKIYTYQVGEIETTTTRCGYLINHLPLSYAISVMTWIGVESALHREVPEELKDHINHIILAHHGALEYGSPVKPMSIEAYIVHVADMMDSCTSNYAEAAIVGQADEQGMIPGSRFSSRPLFVAAYDR